MKFYNTTGKKQLGELYAMPTAVLLEGKVPWTHWRFASPMARNSVAQLKWHGKAFDGNGALESA